MKTHNISQYMQLPSRPLTFAFAMLLSLPCMLRGQASSYLGTESVMQAIDNEAAVLFAAVGPDPSLNLQYDNTVNSDGSFSWSTIAGLEEPTKGTISLGNTDITYTKPYQRPINTVFQVRQPFEALLSFRIPKVQGVQRMNLPEL